MKSRKGFTLVELLIVIVVIGILSSTMMLSSNEAVNSAKASAIISNLRNLKIAALEWYVDNLNSAENFDTAKDLNSKKDDIIAYLNSNKDNLAKYDFEGTTEGTWAVSYSGNDLNANVSKRLAARAQAAELYTKDGSDFKKYEEQSSNFKVYMKIR